MLSKKICALQNCIFKLARGRRASGLHKKWQIVIPVDYLIRPVQILVARLKNTLRVVESVVVRCKVAVTAPDEIGRFAPASYQNEEQECDSGLHPISGRPEANLMWTNCLHVSE
jgi:hypothetical protein